jgi:hypothetical protein
MQPYSFNFCLCADVNSSKRNFELAFDRKPDDLAYMVEQVEYVFRKECFDPSNYRAFAIDFIVFYEEQTKRWKPLESASQLQEAQQLYAFQANLAKESIQEIPAPIKLIRVPRLPPAGSRSVHNPGFSVVDLDKVEAVFKELDINHSDSLTYTELQHGFAVAGIDFNQDAIEKLFEKSDANGDGCVSWDEFRIFADLFPNTTETLYWRLCHFSNESSSRSLETADELKRLRQREHDLKRDLAENQQASKLLEQRLRQERAIAREADPRRRFLEAEEQDLMNKEFALQFHRDMVIQAETQFSETAVRFDHAAAHQGSPRRARMLNS